MIYETGNFLLEYNDILYSNNIIKEYYRLLYYNKLKKKLLKYRHKYLKNKSNKNNKTKYLSKNYSTDILSIIIFNHKYESKNDPIFDSCSPFEYSILNDYLNKKCLSISKSQKKMILSIYPELSKKYLKYFKKLQKNNYNDKYIIDYFIDNYSVNIYLFIDSINYDNYINIPLHIFDNLIKKYNLKNYNKYDTNEILDNKVIEYIYILYNRYNVFSSGNNQGSILPSFKLLLKKYFNIKVELFASPINSSNYTLGSFFYDIDQYFGSLGNFFNMNIKKGYYEVNPPFDKCIINELFKKLLLFFNNADKNNNPLLMLMILPNSYKSLNNKINLFKKFNTQIIFIEKNKFPYIRYNRDFTQTIVSPIVDTNIIIIYNDFINDYVKNNILNIKNIIDSWIK